MAVSPDRHGPWAVVTGASAGLGRAFAETLAARGLHPVLVARRRERLETLAAELRATHGVEALAVPLDLCREDAPDRLQEALGDREVGLLVNNAGFGSNGPFHQTDAAWLRRMVRLNCEVPVALARLLLPAMVARGRGGLLFVSSITAYQATPWMAVYGASKAFDLHLAEALAVELAGTGVDVLALSPGHTATEFHEVAGTGGPATRDRPADPREVVAASLDRLGRAPALVPGLRHRLRATAVRLLPRSWAAAAAGRVLARRLPSGRG